MGMMPGNRARGFRMTARIVLVLGFSALALGACTSSSGLHQMASENSTVHLDGTMPAPEPTASARRVAQRRAAPAVTDDVRAQDVSGGNTTGTRNAGARREPAQKPFSDEWWENEKREDARLKQKMNICRGC